jgi:hypothetical protein
MVWIGAVLALASMVSITSGGSANGAPAAVARHASAAPDTMPQPDLTEYQRLLDDFLSVTSKPGQPIETRFDYWELNHKTEVGERLAKAKLGLISVAPSRMSDRGRLAWAINTYNYLVIQMVTENLYDRRMKGYIEGKPAWMKPMHKSVQEIGFNDGTFFETRAIQIEGKDYSLDSFERHFLFADFDRASKAPPPKSLDPRVHFALVCGAKGCPPLMPRAYQSDSLDRQLDAAVRNALSSPQHLKIDPANGSIAVSSIFNWYASDFGGQPGIIEFLKRYAPAEDRAIIEKKKARFVNSFIEWDWGLNMKLDEKGGS